MGLFGGGRDRTAKYAKEANALARKGLRRAGVQTALALVGIVVAVGGAYFAWLAVRPTSTEPNVSVTYLGPMSEWVVEQAAAGLGTPPKPHEFDANVCDRWRPWLVGLDASPTASSSGVRLTIDTDASTAVSVTHIRAANVERTALAADHTRVVCSQAGGLDEGLTAELDLDDLESSLKVRESSYEVPEGGDVVELPPGRLNVEAGFGRTVNLYPKLEPGFVYSFTVEIDLVVDGEPTTLDLTDDGEHFRLAAPTAEQSSYDPVSDAWVPGGWPYSQRHMCAATAIYCDRQTTSPTDATAEGCPVAPGWENVDETCVAAHGIDLDGNGVPDRLGLYGCKELPCQDETSAVVELDSGTAAPLLLGPVPTIQPSLRAAGDLDGVPGDEAVVNVEKAAHRLNHVVVSWKADQPVLLEGPWSFSTTADEGHSVYCPEDGSVVEIEWSRAGSGSYSSDLAFSSRSTSSGEATATSWSGEASASGGRSCGST